MAVVRGKGVEVVKGRWWREVGRWPRWSWGGRGWSRRWGMWWRGAQPASRRHGRDLFPVINNSYHQICNRILRSLMPGRKQSLQSEYLWFHYLQPLGNYFPTAISLQSCTNFKINFKKYLYLHFRYKVVPNF